MTTTQMTTESTMAKSALTDGQSASGVIRPLVGEKAIAMEASVINVKGAETSQRSPPYLCKSEEPSSHIEEPLQLAGLTSIGKEESHSETTNAGESTDIAHKAVTCKPDIQPTARSMAPGTQPDKTAGKGKKKKRHQPPEDKSANVPKSNSLKDQQQHVESPESAPSLSEDASTESESPGVPESDTASESWGEGEDDVGESREIGSNKEGTTSTTGKVRSSTSFVKDIDVFTINYLLHAFIHIFFSYSHSHH